MPKAAELLSMTAFERFARRQNEQIIANWPASAPVELQRLTREQAVAALKEIGDVEPMPDAELTPEMVLLRRAWRGAQRDAFEALLSMGRTLLAIKKRDGEAAVQPWVTAHAPSVPWEDCELAMRAVAEQGPAH